MKVNHNNFVFLLIITFVLCACAGCGESYKREQDVVSDMTSKKNNVTLHDEMISIDVLHSEKKTVEMKKLEELNIREDDEYVQNNNNIINGGFIIPYQEGYFYSVETSLEGSDSTLMFDDGQGNVTERKEEVGIQYISDDSIYFYDQEKNILKRKKEEQIGNIINFQYSEWNYIFYAADYIYYTDIDEDHSSTYIGRVDYDGKQNQKLYEFNVCLEQIYQYRNELWFVYYDFQNEDKSSLGKINLIDNNVAVYNIHPGGNSTAGCRMSFNNGYVYFNSSGFNRMNIQDDYVEQIFEKKVDAVNFVENSILFCKDKKLYKMDSDGLKKIKTLQRKTDGFDGIRVDDNKIYIEIFGGASHYEIFQIDLMGSTIKDIIK